MDIFRRAVDVASHMVELVEAAAAQPGGVDALAVRARRLVSTRYATAWAARLGLDAGLDASGDGRVGSVRGGNLCRTAAAGGRGAGGGRNADGRRFAGSATRMAPRSPPRRMDRGVGGQCGLSGLEAHGLARRPCTPS